MFDKILKKTPVRTIPQNFLKPDWLNRAQEHEIVQQLAERIAPEVIKVHSNNNDISFVGWKIGEYLDDYPYQKGIVCAYTYHLILAPITPLKNLYAHLEIREEKQKYPYLILSTVKNADAPEETHWQGHSISHKSVRNCCTETTKAGEILKQLEPYTKFLAPSANETEFFIYNSETQIGTVGLSFVKEELTEILHQRYPYGMKESGFEKIWD